ATWVMQGWMFHHKAEFWQPTQIKSFLDGVPDDNILVLDLFSENKPVWSRTEAFYGKPWIWNMLHNFGGNISLYGRMPSVANGPAEALNSDGSGRLSGIGLTMEGLEQNPVMYSLMLENTWSNKPINVEQWLKGYVTRRYGAENDHLDKAWKILKSTVYDGSLINGGPESIITGRPTFNKTTTATRANIFYNPVDLLPAWEHFVKAIPEIERGDGFEYDLVDVTRQVMANYAQVLQQNYAASVKAKQMDKASQYSKQFITLIDDLDEVLAIRKEFLLGVWLENAKALGTNLEERNLYEKNARMIITLWGDEHGLYDYSNRQWAGLMKNFYKRRWENFFQFVEDSHKKG
ncbi:MAG TPA: alpha-N-acetylglucosaminidase C-terminal domain-containing protein, partial [Sphingobacteriaceae bacterium]